MHSFWFIYRSQNKASELILINYGLQWLRQTIVLEVMTVGGEELTG